MASKRVEAFQLFNSGYKPTDDMAVALRLKRRVLDDYYHRWLDASEEFRHKGKSKEQQAFDLFDQGYTMTSPELKSLGLKYSVRFEYLKRWRKKKTQQLTDAAKSIAPRIGHRICVRIFRRSMPGRPLASVIINPDATYNLTLTEPEGFYFDTKVLQ